MNGIQVHILTGFLGSGKTTAICDLLKHKKTTGDWAVIINEFGKISVDSLTLKSARSGGKGIYKISGGCICCSAEEHFQTNLSQIVDQARFEKIIIEPSGLGGAEMVSSLVREHPKLRLMPVICMVDIFSLEHPRMDINMIYRSQILQADTILFTKCDLLSDQSKQNRLIEKFRSMFPDKPYFLKSGLTRHELRKIITTSEPDKFKQNKKPLLCVGLDLKSESYFEESLVYPADIRFDLKGLGNYFFKDESVIRAKGFLRDKKGWKLINFTRSGFTLQACSPKDENKLVIIYARSGSGDATGFQADMKNLIHQCRLVRQIS